MKIDIITAFPKSFSFLSESIPKRAQQKGLVEISFLNLMDFGTGKWNKIDDRPYGGGEGMLIGVDPVYKALKSIGAYPNTKNIKVVITGAGGEEWSQSKAESYSRDIEHLVIICGHYEGIDHRVKEEFVDEEISIGNYILSGGELASMVMVDSMVRLIPGVLGNDMSAIRETTFHKDYRSIEPPVYTRPGSFTTEEGKELKVPEILLSGDHVKVEEWRKDNAEKKDYS